MKIIRGLLILLGLCAATVAGLYWYYLYTPSPAEIVLAGQYHSESISSDGIDRSFSYYVPANLESKASLIFVLHGSTGSGDQIREQTGWEFDQLADSHQFIVVYPTGFENHWNGCRASADYSANTQDIDDVSFIRHLVSEFVQRHEIDPQRVFVTGHSNGGHMAYRLALEAPQLVRAIAPVSASLPVDENLGCEKSGLPVSIAIFNGTEDPVNPYEGGLVDIMGNASRGAVRSSMDTIRYWAKLAGADTQSLPVAIEHPEYDRVSSTSVHEQRWKPSSGTDVRLYTLLGSGHVFPSKLVSSPRILGPGAGDISGPEEIVEFFEGVARLTPSP